MSLKLRNKIEKLLSLTLTISLCVLSLASCGKNTHTHCELTISLPSSFTSYETERRFDLALSDGETVVGVIRMSFDACYSQGIPVTLSAENFGEFYKSRAGSEAEMKRHGAVPYYEERVNDGYADYYYLFTFYRSLYAYFMVMYVTPAAFAEENRAEFLEYADAVAFRQVAE